MPYMIHDFMDHSDEAVINNYLNLCWLQFQLQDRQAAF